MKTYKLTLRTQNPETGNWTVVEGEKEFSLTEAIQRKEEIDSELGKTNIIFKVDFQSTN